MNLDKIGQKMEHGDILKTSARAIGERRETYGPPKESFDRAAVLASAILDKQVLPHEIALIMHAVKLARIASNPANQDHYVDGISYLAFAGEFLEAVPLPQNVVRGPSEVTKPVIIDGRPVVPARPA
jgi:hypothetical protein